MNYHDVMENVKRKAGEMIAKQRPPDVIQYDPQAEAMKQAYLEMMSMPAWKDFSKIMSEICDAPLNYLDEKTVGEVTLADAGYIKGVRSAVKTLTQKVQSKIK